MGCLITERNRLPLLTVGVYFRMALVLSLIQKLERLKQSLNTLLEEEDFGGGLKGGHGLVIAMHLLNHMGNFQKLSMLFTTDYDTHCKEFTCLQEFHGAIKVCNLYLLSMVIKT